MRCVTEGSAPYPHWLGALACGGRVAIFLSLSADGCAALVTPSHSKAFDGNAGEPGVHLLTPFVRSDTGERLIVQV